MLLGRVLSARKFGLIPCAFGTISSKYPLIEHVKSSWPAPRPPVEVVESLPERTIPDSALHFEMKATFDHGMAIYYPHLKMHPADCKVALRVSINDIKISDEEMDILKEMVGPRYNTGKKIIRLTSNRFPNRIENKRYLTLLLEKLVAESKRLLLLKDSYN